MCGSSPRVFDSLFKTCAHMKKFRNATVTFFRFRNATDTFFQMKDYGLLPTVESCNAYLSSLLDLHGVDIALAFYKEMCRCRISPNVYTLNMVMCAYCKSGKLEKAVKVFEEMRILGISPNDASYNTLITGQVGNSEMGIRLYEEMLRNGFKADILT
ncbi:hypothetical protein GH714_019432 [Hevea brasiliensis]|uniref:Pentacotripeptide-repeat region of PRORP domain-containing protein n=1 Tax=Hevea brasiliensis TaxID=3981 RepID=A0A6A6MU34_HEVBR|nr:hypothetical protein GH714_019432 [Hevea brasiliensis]